jgi:hypothetical protein
LDIVITHPAVRTLPFFSIYMRYWHDR